MDKQPSLAIIIPNHNEKLVFEVKVLCLLYFGEVSEIIILNDSFGKGKGWAIREGVKKSTAPIIIFLDGDMDISPKEILKLLPKLNDADIVIGTKKVEGLLKRKMITRISRWIIKCLFKLPVSDTQTGLKIFKRSALPQWETNDFMFDVEILYKAHKEGFKIIEVPIEINSPKTKTLKQVLNSLCSTVSLWYRLSYR